MRPFHLDESLLNRSINVAARIKASYLWAGNIVVIKSRVGNEHCTNMTPEDVELRWNIFKAMGMFENRVSSRGRVTVTNRTLLLK